MLVVDNPTLYDRPFEDSTFVIISLDPAASVAELDEEAKAEAAQMHPTKYLALMDDDVGRELTPDARAPPLSLKFYLAYDGLPDPPLDWAATPVSPAPAHPATGREPVTSSSPLPWPNCHLTSLDVIIGIVSRIHQHHTPGPSFTRQQRNIFARHARNDNNSYEPEDDEGFDAEYEEALAELREEMRELEEEQPAVAEDDARGMFEIIPQDNTPQMKLNVEMWVDLASIDRPGNPANLMREIRHLKEIEWRWAQRVVAASLAKKPETSAWLEGISGADAPSAGDDADVIDDMDGDMSIIPEDAIEHRAERLAELNDTSGPAIALSPTRSSLSTTDLVLSPAVSASVHTDLSALSGPKTNSGTPTPTPFRSNVIGMLGGYVSGFLAKFSRIMPYASRLRSLFLTWIWRPFAR
ncbi:hypothetical protein EXIGLDRAFT_834630 [Exidia glandulosa HHB12029]|uniref:Uncharacterized protein n=1 Tax=Exidia glandulosa HHB12029 TaxID=1314781 RepID=A0A165JJ67_EXIGL|nr:hypothetical protein EXIGLDRAFT_834630 [Exidia glandulosa HHB12029]